MTVRSSVVSSTDHPTLSLLRVSSAKRKLAELIEKLAVAGWLLIVDYVPRRKYETGVVREYVTATGPAGYILFHNGSSRRASSKEA